MTFSHAFLYIITLTFKRIETKTAFIRHQDGRGELREMYWWVLCPCALARSRQYVCEIYHVTDANHVPGIALLRVSKIIFIVILQNSLKAFSKWIWTSIETPCSFEFPSYFMKTVFFVINLVSLPLFCLLLLLFFDKVSSNSLCTSGTNSVEQASLELTEINLSQPFQYWYYNTGNNRHTTITN